MKKADLIVFSHVRWDFVYQRPQHLMTALAADRRVYFIEEPVRDDNVDPFWEKYTPARNITVCRPHTFLEAAGFCDSQMSALRFLLRRLLREEKINDHRCAAWLYTPLAAAILDEFSPRAIVYDCMDDLAAFVNAPRDFAFWERELLRQADVVFTGGPSLHQSRKDQHPNIHCFPSSVDADHFGRAKPDHPQRVEEPRSQRELPRPRLGYFGVIDERFDVDVVRHLAHARPDWQIVLVGPVAKIDRAILPRAENIHYFGRAAYDALPQFLAGWDVCLLPFALNRTTRFISPTKTLEYMAAERPIVSTPIADVAEPYGDIVYLGGTPEEFVAACERALAADEKERADRAAKMRAVLARTSWRSTAAAMDELLTNAIETKERRASESAAATTEAEAPAEVEMPARDEFLRNGRATPPVVVIGAGPTGLSAAYHLGADALLIEKEDRVGGWCRSREIDGFTFDFAGHIMFSNDPYVHELYDRLLGDNVHWQDREAWIYSKSVYTRYPFQGSLHGLPPEVIKECLVGAIEARFGSLNGDSASAKPGNGHVQGNGHNHGNGRERMGARPSALDPRSPLGKYVEGSRERAERLRTCDTLDDCCGDGIMESTAKLGGCNEVGTGEFSPQNFEEFIYKVWGSGIAKHFAIPYNRKLWAVDLKEMDTSWLGGRVPLPNLEEMIDGALRPSPKPMGPNARFGYPLHGGFQALMDGFLPLLRGPVWRNRKVAAVSPRRHTVTLDTGEVVPFDSLISTMPLPALIRSMGDEAPADVQAAAASLRSISVRCVHLGIGREKLTDKHWIYYPEDTVFHRIFAQGNASPHCNPPGGFGLTCEITYSPQKPLPCEGDALIERCVEDCRRVGMFGPGDPVWVAFQVDLPYAYVVYDHTRAENVRVIRSWLESHDILLAGRYSEWEYYNSDHAFLAGKKAAQRCSRRSGAMTT